MSAVGAVTSGLDLLAGYDALTPRLDDTGSLRAVHDVIGARMAVGLPNLYPQ